MVMDIHSHILPKIDDGSHSTKESIWLLEREQEQGVAQVVCTPHFYAQQVSVERFLSRRSHSRDRLLEEIGDRTDLPKLRYGAEVYYFPGIGRADMLPELCVDGTNVLLLELPFGQWDKQVADDVKEILEKQRLTVILAHVERYIGFQKDRSFWDEIMELPLNTQLNGECFLKWKIRRFGLEHIKTGKPVLLGSDCHNSRTRIPNLEEARAVISRKLGDDVLMEIDALAERLLQV